MSSTTASGPAFRFHPKLWIAAALLLVLPAAAMLVTGEVDWGAADFAIFGAVLAMAAAAIEASLNWLTAPRYRIGASLLAVLMFLTFWAHLAVGLFD
jgi:hypothetical protein